MLLCMSMLSEARCPRRSSSGKMRLYNNRQFD